MVTVGLVVLSVLVYVQVPLVPVGGFLSHYGIVFSLQEQTFNFYAHTFWQTRTPYQNIVTLLVLNSLIFNCCNVQLLVDLYFLEKP